MALPDTSVLFGPRNTALAQISSISPYGPSVDVPPYVDSLGRRYFVSALAVGGLAVERFLADGSKDPTFVCEPSSFMRMYASPGGDVYILSEDGDTVRRLKRLTETGAFDPTFTAGVTFGAGLAFSPAGDIYACRVNGSGSIDPIRRLNHDGSVDLSWQSGITSAEVYERVVVDADGRVYTEHKISYVRYLMRLNGDGTTHSFFVNSGPMLFLAGTEAALFYVKDNDDYSTYTVGRIDFATGVSSTTTISYESFLDTNSVGPAVGGGIVVCFSYNRAVRLNDDLSVLGYDVLADFIEPGTSSPTLHRTQGAGGFLLRYGTDPVTYSSVQLLDFYGSGAVAPPAEGITFTQLAATPQPEIPTTANGVLLLAGAAYESSLSTLGAAANGYLTLVGGGPAGYVPEAPNYGIAEGVLAFTGYAYAPGVEAPAGADGILALDGYAFESSDVGFGTLALDGYATAYDGGLLPTAPGGDHWISLQDSLALAETVSTRMTTLLRTRMALDDRTRTRTQAHANLSDGLALADEMAAIFQLLLESGFVLSDGLGFSHVALLRLHDHLLLTGQATASREAWARMAEAIAFGDMFEGTELVTFESGLSLADEAAARYEAAARLIDSILLTDTLTDSFSVSILLSDSLGLNDQLVGKAELLAAMRDSVGFAAHLRVKGELYTAWTMNTDSKASTQYQNYPFNSFMRVGGRHYGVADSGLYRLDGDDDAGTPIDAKIRLGLSTLGSRLMKQVPSVYLGYSASGDLLLKAVIADSATGQREAHVYRLYADGADTTREGRTKLGKGLSAVYWDFQIENVNGADFDIDNIEFMPLVINRRLRGNAGGK